MIWLCLLEASLLVTSAGAPCAEADAQLVARLLEDALSSYQELLKANPELECASEGLRSVAESYAALGEALSLLGDEAGALEAFTKALEIAPETRVSGMPPRWFSEAKDSSGAIFHILLSIIAVLLALLLVVLLLRRLIRRPGLQISSFETDDTEEDRVKSFESLLSARLLELAHGSRGGDLSLVTGELNEIDIPAEIENLLPAKVSWIGSLVKLVDQLLKRKTLVVTGTLHPPGRRGPGVTLCLTGGSDIAASQTLWLRDFHGRPKNEEQASTSAYYRLADYASVWLLFTLSESLEAQSLSLLGTSDWRSYALFRAALVEHRSGEETKAKILYRQALRRAPELRGARVNLAKLLKDLGDTEEMEPLRFAIRLLEETICDSADPMDPAIYTARYLKAGFHHDLEDLDSARREAAHLVEQIEEAERQASKSTERSFSDRLPSLFTKRVRNRNRANHLALTTYLQSIRPAALLMLGTLEEITDRAKTRESGRDRFKDVDRYSPLALVQYNFASSHSLLAEHASDNDEREKQTKEAMAHLERALLLREGYTRIAAKDLTLRFLRRWSGSRKRYESLMDRFSSNTPSQKTAVLSPAPPAEDDGSEPGNAPDSRGV